MEFVFGNWWLFLPFVGILGLIAYQFMLFKQYRDEAKEARNWILEEKEWIVGRALRVSSEIERLEIEVLSLPDEERVLADYALAIIKLRNKSGMMILSNILKTFGAAEIEHYPLRYMRMLRKLYGTADVEIQTAHDLLEGAKDFFNIKKSAAKLN